MKPRINSRSSRSKSQDSKHDDKGSKKAKEKHQKVTSGSVKPLTGKIFYLDLPSNKRNETLENDIQTLGGTVEKFFSKDIRYLVSSKPEARYVHRLVRESPVPSPESVLSSPHPSSSKEGHRSSSQGPTEPVQVSRGKSLVKKVVKEQERIQINKMLSNALEWGVKILHIEEMIAYIEKKKPAISAQQKTDPHAVKKTAKPSCYGRTFQKHSATRISKPFVKVEDSSRHYRPFYLHMAQMPMCNFNSVPPASPFQVEERRQSTHGPEGRGGKGKHRGRQRREKKRGGYCECCGLKYDKLQAHLEGEQHRAFVAGDHYKQLDALIAQLPWVFATEQPSTQRVKCSVPTSPICASLVRDQAEEAGGSAIGGLQKRAQSSSSLGTSCSSRRKRGREPLSGESRGSSEELADVLESSRSKRGSFKWDSSHTLLRALVDSLHSDKVSDAAVMEMTTGLQHTESRHHRRTYQRKRHVLSSSHTVNWKHAGTPGTTAAPCEEVVTLTELLQDSPGETTQCKTACVTHQDIIQGKPVDFTYSQEKPVDVTQQELIHAKLVGTPQQNSTRVGPEDLIQQDSIQGKPVGITQLESVQAEPVAVTQQDSILEKLVEVTVEDQSFRTFTPAVSIQQQQHLPGRTKKKAVDSSDSYPEHTQNATNMPIPMPTALFEDPADCWTAGAFSPLRRKVRAERSWRGGRSLTLRLPAPEPCGMEDSQASPQQSLDLWELFQDNDDMQEDFLGFAD